MEKSYDSVNKYASIINRMGMIYFDQCLEPYEIGSGQMFFLLCLSDAEGISILELATIGFFDKGTTTRAVQKLEETGFLYRRIDAKDKRIQRLFLSPQGWNVIPVIKKAVRDWEDIILNGMESEDREQARNLLIHMAENATAFTSERKKEAYERNHQSE